MTDKPSPHDEENGPESMKGLPRRRLTTQMMYEESEESMIETMKDAVARKKAGSADYRLSDLAGACRAEVDIDRPARDNRQVRRTAC